MMFADAVHPTHAVRAVGCWAPKNIPVAITQSSGRERLEVAQARSILRPATHRAVWMCWW